MKLFVSIFLLISFYSSAFGQKQEDSINQKINMVCDPSVEDMMLYIIDDVYTITEDQKRVASNINNSDVLSIWLLLPGEDDFEKEVAKTVYPDKIRKVVVIRLREGTASPFETNKEE